MNYLTLGVVCSIVLVTCAHKDQLANAIESLDPHKVEQLLKQPGMYTDTCIDETIEQCKPTRSEKILGTVSGVCGLSALISSAMYINNWGSMRSKVAKSHLGHNGFKTLAGPMVLLSCLGLYKGWSVPRKRLQKALEIKRLLDAAQLS